jgi:DNA-binding transcriptional ArsR family regulator
MEEKNDELIEIETDFGFGILPREIMRSSLSITAKTIYAYLASFAGNTRKAFPSVRLICNELGMSENTFYKYLKELKDLGVVEIIKEREQGKFAKNIYKLSPYLKLSCTAESCTVNLGTNNNNIINNNNYNNIKEKINKKEKFVKPTLEELQNYINEKKLNVNAEHFIDYYEANGWKVGKNPMKDWKATIRNWHRRNEEFKKPTLPKKEEPVPDWFDKEIEAKTPNETSRKEIEEIINSFKVKS